jgi:membrane protease YdiL (CAAX protease family)
MLFSVKNRWGPTLLLLAVFASGSLAARALLGLSPRLSPYPGLIRDTLLGLTLLLVGDALLHGALQLALRARYLHAYSSLAAYFQPQRPREILASGMLAGGGEELLFRGVLLPALIERVGVGLGIAVLLTAFLFGTMHLLPDRRLRLFAVWAVWQGVLLGALFLWTGSLLVPMLVHGAHDTIGFSLFAWERRRAPTRGAPTTDQRL